MALGNTPAHLTTSLVACHEADTRRGGQLSVVQLEDVRSCIAFKAESPWSNACCYRASSDCSGEQQRTSAPIWIRSSNPLSHNQQPANFGRCAYGLDALNKIQAASSRFPYITRIVIAVVNPAVDQVSPTSTRNSTTPVMEQQAAPRAPRDPIPMVLKPAPASSTHTTHSTRTSRNEVQVVLPENMQQPSESAIRQLES